MMVGTWLKRISLWAGLVLCIYALWQARAFSGDAIGRVDAAAWALIGLLLMVIWLLSVSTWRQYVVAYLGRTPAWRTAMRQVGLLLVGKYVPGGVFGFLARLYDEPEAPRNRLFVAGLAEQAVGVVMPIAVGATLLITARSHNLLWLSLVLPLPILALVGVWSVHHVAGWLSWGRRYDVGALIPSWSRLLRATTFQLALQAVWVTTIVVIVREVFQADTSVALGLAGAFMLSVAAGMIVVVAPGGIGVREAALIGLAAPWLGTSQAVFLSAFLRLLSTTIDLTAGALASVMRPSDDKHMGGS